MAVNTEVRGVLSKWTNYWGGWKPRWFVLSKGVFAYYNTEDEEDKGCKASINVSAIDINVFSNDKTRFDITVQSEQHWCLKAKSSLERQSWLIAIATAKAGKEKGHLPIVVPSSSENHAKLKQKISELKLYTDLIVHQVVEIKTEANRATIDQNKLSDASGILSTTCDTFLGTLEQCMSLAENRLNYPLKPGRQNSSSVPPIHRQSSHRSHRSNSSGSTTPTNPFTSIHPLSNSFVEDGNNDDEFLDSLESTSGDGNKNAISKMTVTKLNIPLRPVEVQKPMTLFSNMDHGFKDIKLEPDGGIPTESFLAACKSIIPFFDSIGPTAFAPVKIDMNGNVNKIQTKYVTNKNRFAILQNIIEQEMEIQVTKVRNSATVATLWLKRALSFIYHFLINLKEGERDLQVALTYAYTLSLKQFHGWVVRGVFSLAVKAAPNYDNFIKVLALDPEYLLDEKYEACFMSELDDYLTAMEVILTIIDNFYQKHDLDDQSVV